MTLHIPVPATLETWLRLRAASGGLAPEEVVLQLVQDAAATGREARDAGCDRAGAGPGEAIDEWCRGLEEWATSFPPVTHFVDDSRESIYAGRGE
jgi:hypothetical protein